MERGRIMAEIIAWVVAGLILSFRFVMLAALIFVIYLVISGVHSWRKQAATRGAPASK
jgi:hypothetical protein